MTRHSLGLVSEQSFYNLAARQIELEVLPSCRYHGVGLIPWSPLGGGLLGGILEKQEHGRRANPAMTVQIDAHRAQLEAYERFCQELGHVPWDVALAWLLVNPAVTAPIVDPRETAQLLTTVRGVDITLAPDALQRLDDIWPGPGGAAPEAYAW